MTNFNPQSRSFIVLIVLVLLTSWGAIQLSKHFRVDRLPAQVQPKPVAAEQSPLPTNDWLSYIDPVYPLVFKYPKDWEVANVKTEPDYYVVSIAPKSGKSEILVYINDQDYYALGGLPSTDRRIGGQAGLAYGETLASAKVGKYYYTFDSGTDTSLVPIFKSLLTTIEFR